MIYGDFPFIIRVDRSLTVAVEVGEVPTSDGRKMAKKVVAVGTLPLSHNICLM
jgi:hypothetical protein